MCTVQLPPGDNPLAVNKYIISFRFSTRFEQPCAHHQESQLYQYNRWGSSLPICIPDSHLHRLTYTRCCIDTIASPDDKHRVARNMYRIEINIYKRNCASSWLFIRIIQTTLMFTSHLPHPPPARARDNHKTHTDCI